MSNVLPSQIELALPATRSRRPRRPERKTTARRIVLSPELFSGEADRPAAAGAPSPRARSLVEAIVTVAATVALGLGWAAFETRWSDAPRDDYPRTPIEELQPAHQAAGTGGSGDRHPGIEESGETRWPPITNADDATRVAPSSR